jgi:glycosyltransferase involved in cell wall biosynthesis
MRPKSNVDRAPSSASDEGPASRAGAPAAKPRLLFLTPIRPLRAGGGLGMRAGIVLEALADDFDVFVLVIPVVGEPSFASPVLHRFPVAVRPVTEPRALATRDVTAQLARMTADPRPALFQFATPDAVAALRRVWSGRRFDLVHVFRLYLAPFAGDFLDAAPPARPACWLDLDELESATRLEIAALHERAGQPVAAAVDRLEAAKYVEAEREYLPRFDRVFVCSEPERAAAAAVCGDRVVVLPNAVRVPGATARAPREDGRFTWLFTGSLGYYPNEDAAAFLCEEVLPRLRSAATHPIRIVIAGSQPSRRTLQLASQPEVTVAANVGDMAAAYRDADAVVVPIRAGGGTRIKILEAFAHRRPVVSTTAGARGLDVVSGEHLLVADSAGDLARCCVRLMEEPHTGAALAERAWRWVQAHHTIENVRERLRACWS